MSCMTFMYNLDPLPYAYDALEPFIDEETMHYHHDKHYKTYVDNLNRLMEENPQYKTVCLEEILAEPDKLPEPIRQPFINNGGGVYNHQLYFSLMEAAVSKNKNQEILNAIDKEYGSMQNFTQLFKDAALKQFGSGYAWLVMSKTKELAIVATSNQFTPLPSGLYPLLLVDVWEHAYYLKYKNERNKYLDNWFYVVNWDKVNERYLKGCENHCSC